MNQIQLRFAFSFFSCLVVASALHAAGFIENSIEFSIYFCLIAILFWLLVYQLRHVFRASRAPFSKQE